MNKNKVTMIIYGKHGKVRVTEDEEQQRFASPPEGDLVQKLLDIREEKKKSEIC